MADTSARTTRARDPLARPLLWRLPLVAFVLVGLVGVASIDALLRRDVEREAERHAEQVQALLGGRMRDRASALHALTVALGALGEGPEHAPSFLELSRQLHATAPEVVTLALVDTLGNLRERLVRSRPEVKLDPEPREPGAMERAIAVATAVQQRRLTITPTVTLRDGSPGVILYDPIVRDERVIGLVGAGVAHARLLTGIVATLENARFSHRVRDGEGEEIARGRDWPANPQRVVSRAVALPDGRGWLVDIAIFRFEPFLPRLLTGLAGAAVIALVVIAVLREAARGERLAEHSLRLELLSRDLLDANIRLEERAVQVAEANRAKSRFLANVSHELRTPINAIVGYNALALDGMYGALAAPLREAHERVGQAARHLRALVDDVLDLSRIETGRMSLEATPVDLGRLLESIAAVVEPTAAAKGVHVDIVLGRDLPRLTTDARHLRRVLLNLATNAVKFTEHGVVTLVARRDPSDPERRLTIAVEDTGIGIAPADQRRIFDEFEQVHSDARGDSQRRGVGLGLSVARQLARLLGGEIELESVPGQGSRFTVRLPLDTPALEGSAPRATRSASATRASSAAEMERAIARSRELVGEPPRTDQASVATPDATSAARADQAAGVDARERAD